MPYWVLGLGVDLHANFFSKNRTELPPCKIVTLSYEIELVCPKYNTRTTGEVHDVNYERSNRICQLESV